MDLQIKLLFVLQVKKNQYIAADNPVAGMRGAFPVAIIAMAVAAISAVAQDVRGFVCEPVVPDQAAVWYDFSQKGAIDEALCRYQYSGDSAVSVTMLLPRPSVREDYELHGDTVRLLCRESRAWISRDSIPSTVVGDAITAGILKRRVRRYMSEHYILDGEYAYSPMGVCNVILADGDTVCNVQLMHSREIFDVRLSDASYSPASDSIAATVMRDRWIWGTGAYSPMLACTELTVTDNRYTGDLTHEGYTTVFPRLDNPDVWPDAVGRGHSLQSVSNSVMMRGEQGEGEAGNNALPYAGTAPEVSWSDGVMKISSNVAEAVSVLVTDIAGRVIHSCEVHGSAVIPTGGWPYGEYVVRAGDTVRKIILMP